jgi:hypothetical protein
MKEVALVTLLLTVLFSGLLFSQQTENTSAPTGVFGCAINSRQVIVNDKDWNLESRLLRAFRRVAWSPAFVTPDADPCCLHRPQSHRLGTCTSR